MSEEKLYAVKNNVGKWLNQYYFWGPETWATPDKDDREKVAKHYGGHIVTFVEEPEKVVLTKEQAEIVEGANKSQFPASYISDHTGSSYCLEKLLMDAYANGYTVAKEKKYNVKVPHTDDSYFYKIDHETCNAADSFHIDLDRPEAKFTKLEINHYDLQDYKKEEVTDDE